MPGLELRQLNALESVVRTGSFGRAARELGYTQSAVSQQIAGLERLVGARLLERSSGRRPLGPTEAGTLLLRHTQRIIASLRAAEADLAALAAGAAGSLRVGTFQSIGMSILPPLLSRFRDAWPDVEVTLIESVSREELLAQLERGELDVTFSGLPIEEGPFAVAELMLDPYVLLVQRDSPLALRGRALSRKELGELVLVGYQHPGLPPNVETHLRALGVVPRIVFRSDENATVQGLVAAGVAAAIIPRLAVNFDDERVAPIDLAGLVPPRVIGVAWHADRYRSSAASAFGALAQTICEEITADRTRRMVTA